MNHKKEMEKIIASDSYNLLRDNENRFKYYIKRMYYKLKGVL